MQRVERFGSHEYVVFISLRQLLRIMKNKIFLLVGFESAVFSSGKLARFELVSFGRQMKPSHAQVDLR